MKLIKFIFLGFLVAAGSFFYDFKSADGDGAESGRLFRSLPDAGEIRAAMEDKSRNISTFYFTTKDVALEEIRGFLGVFDLPEYSIVKLGGAYYIIYLPHYTEETSGNKHLLLIAGQLRESKAFLIKHPDAAVFADKENGMVEYMVMKKNQSIQRAVRPYLRFQVFINPNTRVITQKVVECWDGKELVVKKDEEVLGYLKSEKCLL